MHWQVKSVHVEHKVEASMEPFRSPSRGRHSLGHGFDLLELNALVMTYPLIQDYMAHLNYLVVKCFNSVQEVSVVEWLR